jgi:hypothetical protein
MEIDNNRQISNVNRTLSDSLLEIELLEMLARDRMLNEFIE